MQRDVRLTIKNFKKSLNEKISYSHLFMILYENIILAGAKKGFLLKMKRQSYVLMIKNAIFLQFMRSRRNNFKKRRRKKIDRK